MDPGLSCPSGVRTRRTVNKTDHFGSNEEIERVPTCITMFCRGVGLSDMEFVLPCIPKTACDSCCRPLSCEYGTYKRVKARFWPQLSGRLPENLLSCSFFVGQRRAAQRKIPSLSCIAPPPKPPENAVDVPPEGGLNSPADIKGRRNLLVEMHAVGCVFFRSRVSSSGLRVSGFGFRVSSFGFRFRVPGFRFRIQGFVFRVSCFGFSAEGVSGLGSRV